MPRIEDPTVPPRASVLDRLLDDEPTSDVPERQLSWREGLSRLRASVLRDVRWILNARVGAIVDTEEAPRRRKKSKKKGESEEALSLDSTVLRFGLRDLTGLDLKQVEDREVVRRAIEEGIARFEPRLTNVRVTMPQDGAGASRTSFHVEARLLVHPDPQKMEFDATVLWLDRRVDIEGAASA